jgi:hypothetical protein
MGYLNKEFSKMEETNQTYNLEKTIWTQDDFEKMGWHDSNVYGFIFERNSEKFTSDIVFDLDYIFEWIQPTEPEKYFSFWIAPCTLIFKDAFDLKIDIEIGQAEFELEIADLHLIAKTKNENEDIYEWNLEFQQGNISLKSHGFEQIVRKNAIYSNEQILDLEKRGGISFSRQAAHNSSQVQ